MIKLPSDFHPELTEDRIQAVTQVILRARTNCLEYHDEKAGDTPWSYGCRAREWIRQDLRKAADDKQNFSYLSILEDTGQKFIFGIAGIPIKFFKDDPDEPALRVRKRSAAELAQLSLFAFKGVNSPEDILWRLLVEINHQDLEVLKIIFVGIDCHEDTLCYYDVPLRPPVQRIYDLAPALEKGIELNSPLVVKKGTKNKEETIKIRP